MKKKSKYIVKDVPFLLNIWDINLWYPGVQKIHQHVKIFNKRKETTNKLYRVSWQLHLGIMLQVLVHKREKQENRYGVFECFFIWLWINNLSTSDRGEGLYVKWHFRSLISHWEFTPHSEHTRLNLLGIGSFSLTHFHSLFLWWVVSKIPLLRLIKAVNTHCDI